MIVKKYGNRRLYDTEASRYITLEDLATRIRDGAEVRVVDAKTSADLTQETLTQIIVEGRGAERIFPAALLHQLIRLGDDALTDFLGRYVEGALELYLQARKATQSLLPFNPMLALFSHHSSGVPQAQGVSAPPPVSARDVEALRAELAELKASLRKPSKRAP
jgi:polyhydroxyalkanoate synthesis repressor PhaR